MEQRSSNAVHTEGCCSQVATTGDRGQCGAQSARDSLRAVGRRLGDFIAFGWPGDCFANG